HDRIGLHHALHAKDAVICAAWLALEVAMDAAANGAVVKGDDLDAAAAARAAAQRAVGGVVLRHEPGYAHGPPAGDGHHRADRMRAVVGRIDVVAPMIPLAIGDARPDGRAIVDVLPFRILDFADLSRLIP